MNRLHLGREIFSLFSGCVELRLTLMDCLKRKQENSLEYITFRETTENVGTPFDPVKLKLLVLIFFVVLYPPQFAHFNPMKWNFTVDCCKNVKIAEVSKCYRKWEMVISTESNHKCSVPWSNRYRIYQQYYSRVIWAPASFALVCPDSPTVWSCRSSMFGMLDTHNDLMLTADVKYVEKWQKNMSKCPKVSRME